MKSKQQMRRDIDHINQLLKDEAVKLSLGTTKSQSRLASARQADDNVTFSYWAQLEFREYCRRQLEKHPVLPASLLIAEGARMIGLSTITAKRYMTVLKAGSTAPLMGFGDNVMLNHGYQPPEQDTYWTTEVEPTEDE